MKQNINICGCKDGSCYNIIEGNSLLPFCFERKNNLNILKRQLMCQYVAIKLISW